MKSYYLINHMNKNDDDDDDDDDNDDNQDFRSGDIRDD